MPQLAPERVFELESVFVQIKSIDALSQVFAAHYYIEMKVRDGQLDPDFWKLSDDKKPINTMTHGDKDGWKVVPSAMWYLENQIHWPNGLTYEIKECKAVPAKNSKTDLTCIVRIEGEFREEMELFDFPLDCQNLSLLFEIQCAMKTSPFPVSLIKSPDLCVAVDDETFVLRNTWHLLTTVNVETFEHKGIRQGGGVINMYPAMSVSVQVNRLASFYLYNIVVPMGLFSFFGIIAPLSMMHTESADRLAIAFSLVLTVAAYKFAISQMVPTVSYLTLIDWYILQQGLIITLVTIQNCVVGMVSGPIGHVFPSFTISPEADLIMLCCIFVLWLVLQIRTAIAWTRADRNRHAVDDDLRLLKKGQSGIVGRLLGSAKLTE